MKIKMRDSSEQEKVKVKAGKSTTTSNHNGPSSANNKLRIAVFGRQNVGKSGKNMRQIKLDVIQLVH